MDAGALVGGEVRDLEAPVARAGCDHDRARRHPLAIRQPQLEAPAPVRTVAPQGHHLVWDRHLGAELLRLVEGARHECHAADASWEAEVVLDPRRRARLTSERASVEHDHGEALRGPVDGGTETCRPGSHDGDVVQPRRIDRVDEAKATREVDVTRVVEDAAVRAEDDRQLRAG